MNNMRIVIAGLQNIFTDKDVPKMEIRKDLETVQSLIEKMLKEISGVPH